MNGSSVPAIPTTHHKGGGERFFITGATGFLGRQIVATLIREHPGAQFQLLVRHQGASERERLMRDWIGAQDAGSRIRILAGDVGESRCGLTASDYTDVIETSTRIIHAAAKVQFNTSRSETERVNVDGTRHALELAEDARRHGTLQSFTYIGTAFVSGDRSGTIGEEELDVGQHFHNHYEETKCAAEKLVRARRAQMPVVILRPSIVVGDSRTGITSSFRTLYWPLKAYARYGWRVVPGFPGVVVDVVPVDFVASAAACLAFEPRAEGRCFHLCAGIGRSATLAELCALAARFFGLPPLRFIHPAVFIFGMRPVLLAILWGSRRRILLQGRNYRHFLRMSAVFDTAQADELLSPHGIHPPLVQEYFEKILQYCIESNWGRKRPDRPQAKDKSGTDRARF